jgi:phage tail protein X
VDVALHGPLVPDVFVLPEASEQPSAAVWVVRQGALRQLTPHIYGRTTDGLVVRVFDYGEGVVLGSIPGSREGLRVATPDVEAGMIGVGG